MNICEIKEEVKLIDKIDNNDHEYETESNDKYDTLTVYINK